MPRRPGPTATFSQNPTPAGEAIYVEGFKFPACSTTTITAINTNGTSEVLGLEVRVDGGGHFVAEITPNLVGVNTVYLTANTSSIGLGLTVSAP